MANKKKRPAVNKFQQEVIRLVKEWKIRLRLQDWDMELVFPAFDFGSIAEVTTNMNSKAAQISFRNPDIHPPQLQGSITHDTEVTVVHELLHIAEAALPSEAKKILQNDPHHEAFIDLTAQALVAAKRGVERLPLL